MRAGQRAAHRSRRRPQARGTPLQDRCACCREAQGTQAAEDAPGCRSVRVTVDTAPRGHPCSPPLAVENTLKTRTGRLTRNVGKKDPRFAGLFPVRRRGLEPPPGYPGPGPQHCRSSSSGGATPRCRAISCPAAGRFGPYLTPRRVSRRVSRNRGVAAVSDPGACGQGPGRRERAEASAAASAARQSNATRHASAQPPELGHESRTSGESAASVETGLKALLGRRWITQPVDGRDRFDLRAVGLGRPDCSSLGRSTREWPESG